MLRDDAIRAGLIPPTEEEKKRGVVPLEKKQRDIKKRILEDQKTKSVKK